MLVIIIIFFMLVICGKGNEPFTTRIGLLRRNFAIAFAFYIRGPPTAQTKSFIIFLFFFFFFFSPI